VPRVDGSELARRILTLQAWSVQPCVRPLGAVHMTAGHNARRQLAEHCGSPVWLVDTPALRSKYRGVAQQWREMAEQAKRSKVKSSKGKLTVRRPIRQGRP
jgi:hypothetical protein